MTKSMNYFEALDRLMVLDRRLGIDQGAKRERQRLQAIINDVDQKKKARRKERLEKKFSVSDA